MARCGGRPSVKPGAVRRILQHPVLSWIARVALGAVFVVAATPKIADPPSFAHMIYNYRILPGTLVNPAAILMPWVELLAGLALLAGPLRRGAAALTMALLVVFLLAIGTNLARNRAVQCGCFDVHAAEKSHSEQISEMRGVLLRDAGLLLLAVQALAAGMAARRNESR
jgi:putative oxidoreductase